MPDPIPWEQWQKKAKKAYKKGVYTKKEMVRDWGFPSDLDPEKDYILFDKGKPYIQDYQKRLARKRSSSRTRNARNVTSTDLADHLNKVQATEHSRILDEASMFALGDPEMATMVEHGVPVSQYHRLIEEGAPDDPSNKYIQRTLDGIAKTDGENFLTAKGLDTEYTILDHEDFDQPPRLVRVDEFNPQAFPSEQGVPFNNLDELKTQITATRAVPENGAVRLVKTAIRNPWVRAGAVGGGLALSTLNAGMVRAETEGDNGWLANTRRTLADAEVALDSTTIAAGATGVGLPVAAATEVASGVVGTAALGLDAVVTNAAVADEAVDLGSRMQWCLKNGTVCIKLPEFGVSERLTGYVGGHEERKAINGSTSPL